MFNQLSFRRKVLLLIIAGFLLRCLLAVSFHLGNDEAYYFTYAVQPDYNYFDHPPLVGLFIRLFTLNLKYCNDLTLRLTAISSGGISTWLIFKSGTLLRNEKIGWYAAVLYNTSIYTSIIAGVFILPDSPQMVFWLLAFYTAIKLLLLPNNKEFVNGAQSGQKNPRCHLIYFGLYAGLAMMCKIHGVFLWVGLGGYILLYDQKWLKSPFLYIALVMTLIIISPIFYWNLQNNFITWRFQGERIEIHHALLNFSAFITTTLGQLFYNNPFNIVVYIGAIIGIGGTHMAKPTKHLLYWFSFPIILVTSFISLFRTTLPHWSGPGFIGLMLLAAYYLDYLAQGHKRKNSQRLVFWLKPAACLVIIVLVAGPLVINYYPGTLGKKQSSGYGQGDFTLDMYGWGDLKREFISVRDSVVKTGQATPQTPIIVAKWFPACHYYFYIAWPMQMSLVGVGNILDLHKFAWLNQREGYIQKGKNAYYISCSEYPQAPDSLYKNDFKNIRLLKTVAEKRSGKLVRYWKFYLLESASRELGHIL